VQHLDPDHESKERALARARERAGTSPTGVGVAYLSRVPRDPRGEPRAGWSAIVAASEGEEPIEFLVVSESRGRHVEFDADALAEALERVAGDGGLERLSELSREGPGLRLDVHAGDDLNRIFV
jgi:hypothetical protein